MMRIAALKAPGHQNDCDIPLSERPAAAFATRQLELEETMLGAAYFLEHLPETRALQPTGRELAAKLRATFGVTLAAAWVAAPDAKRGRGRPRSELCLAPDGKPY